jgi:uncharacterized protein YaaN involved in tellurite resistance
MEHVQMPEIIVSPATPSITQTASDPQAQSQQVQSGDSLETTQTTLPTSTAEAGISMTAIPPLVAPSMSATEIVVKTKTIELTAEEIDKKNAIVSQIDFSDSTLSLNYGIGLEKALTPITEGILSSTRTRDLGAVGGIITDVMVQVKNIDLDGKDKSFLSRLFNNVRNKVEVLKAEFADVEKNINRLDRELEGYQITLRQDFILMEKLYEQNREFARALSLYILAGKEALAAYRTGKLTEMTTKAQRTGDVEDAQEVKRAESLLNSFEKRLDALMTVKTSSIQMAPQIQLMQNNNMNLAESLNNTRSLVLPMWKSQYSLAIMIEHERQIVDVQRKVTDATNELLRKNAEMLKQASVEIAKEGERPIIDIETLRYVNTQIISSLEDILRIQDEGRKMRTESERAYQQIEAELAAQSMKFAQQTSVLSGADEAARLTQ